MTNLMINIGKREQMPKDVSKFLPTQVFVRKMSSIAISPRNEEPLTPSRIT